MPDFYEDAENWTEEQEKAADLDWQRVKDDWSTLFWGSERGRRVLADMLVISGFFDIRFIGNAKVHFNDGAKWFVSHIIKCCGLNDSDGLRRLHELLVSMEPQKKEQENA